jgi:hypothetical protein
MKIIYLVLSINLLPCFIYCQSDTIHIPVDDLIRKLKIKDTTKVESNIGVISKDLESSNISDVSKTSYLDTLIANTICSQLFLIKDTSKEGKSLKSNTEIHITNLYIGVLVDNKIITHAGFVKSSGSNKGGTGIKGGSILVENYESGEMVEWKDPAVSENYVSIASLKNKSSIALGDSTLQAGFYAVASIKDSANVNIHIELYPTLESCKSAVVKNANGIIFSIVPDKGSFRTHVIGFKEPDVSSDSEISFFSPNIKRKK